MLKMILTILVMLYASLSFAAVDANSASAAELDSIKGIGPALSTRIIDERKKGNFKDWNDFVERIKGIGDGNAPKFSAAGLTVNGASFKGAAPTAAPAPKPEVKPATATPPAAAPAAAPAPTKEELKKAKAEEKAKLAAEAKAKKEAEKQAKKDAKKAEAAAPAASAAKK